MVVNCGAIPHELLESELFGYEKGAFTGAVHSRRGRFEMACGGTVFLDEVGEMDPLLQVKLLRVLQEHEIEPVGGTGPRQVDVRVVAATNRNLEAEVAEGRFREDLFYRLNVIPVQLPPLRERGSDVLLLAQAFLERFCQERGRPVLRLSEEVRRIFMAYPWPGNHCSGRSVRQDTVASGSSGADCGNAVRRGAEGDSRAALRGVFLRVHLANAR